LWYISDMSLVRFQTSIGLQNYLDTQRVNSLGQLHESLNNGGRIAWEIHRQRLLLYPQGTQLAGTLFQFDQEKRKPMKVIYIQYVSQTYLIRLGSIYSRSFPGP
jgi:hypothetical protein